MSWGNGKLGVKKRNGTCEEGFVCDFFSIWEVVECGFMCSCCTNAVRKRAESITGKKEKRVENSKKSKKHPPQKIKKNTQPKKWMTNAKTTMQHLYKEKDQGIQHSRGHD